MDDLALDPPSNGAADPSGEAPSVDSGPRDAADFKQILTDGFDALPGGLAIFDAQDRAVLINKLFREMMPEGAARLEAGETFEQVARNTAETVFGLEGSQVEDWLRERLAYRKAPEGHFDQQLTDGRWFRIQESRTSEGGTVTNWTDITDLKLQEQVAENYADALMTTNSQLEEFAHVASHDLQEPLRKIEVFGGRLSEKCASHLDAGGKLYLERIVDATGRMRRLINDLLSFSKIGDQSATFEPVKLSDVLADVQSTLEFRIVETQTKVTVGDLAIVPGNFGQLTRLFQNLLSNSIKYVAEGTAPVIDIRLNSSTDTHVEVAITDNGIGFDQGDAEKIFEVFHRLHGRAGGYEGTGIGLSSCRKIVDQHGGSIRAESAPDAGSTFFVILPTRH